MPDYVSIQNEPDYLHPLLGDLRVRRQRRRIDGRHHRRRVRAGAGRGLPRAFRPADLASPPVLLGPGDHRVQRQHRPEIHGRPRSRASWEGSPITCTASTGDNPGPDWFNGSMSDVGAAAATVGLPTFMTEYSPNAPTMFDTAWLINNALTLENVVGLHLLGAGLESDAADRPGDHRQSLAAARRTPSTTSTTRSSTSRAGRIRAGFAWTRRRRSRRYERRRS